MDEALKNLIGSGPVGIVAFLFLYFYRELALNFRRIVEEHTAAMVGLKAALENHGDQTGELRDEVRELRQNLRPDMNNPRRA
jgi:hypothetical protein